MLSKNYWLYGYLVLLDKICRILFCVYNNAIFKNKLVYSYAAGNTDNSNSMSIELVKFGEGIKLLTIRSSPVPQ